MSRKGFIDKNLIGLKETIKNYSEKATKENQEKISVNKTSEIISSITEHKYVPDKITQNSNEITESQKDDKSLNIDKDYHKALLARKSEFLRTKQDVLKKLKKNLNTLPSRIELYDKLLLETSNINLKLTNLMELIEKIDDKKWDKRDFAVELSDAMRTVENARLEIITQQVKGNCIEEDELPKSTNYNSFIHELLSLTFWQTFKIGFGFSFTLIIGTLLSSIIIALAIMFSMGVI